MGGKPHKIPWLEKYDADIAEATKKGEAMGEARGEARGEAERKKLKAENDRLRKEIDELKKLVTA